MSRYLAPLIMAALLGCDDAPPNTVGAAPAAQAQLETTQQDLEPTASASATLEPAPARSTAAANQPWPGAAPEASADPNETWASVPAAGAITSDYIIDSLVDVGPAGPATASNHGVVMVDRANEVWVARLGTLAATDEPGATPVTPLPEGVGPFPLARGPGVFRGHAYWVSEHSLLRRKLQGSRGAKLERLRTDARNGTRVAVPVGPAAADAKQPLMIGYIAKTTQTQPASATGGGSNETLLARIWRPEHPPLELTPEPASTSSMALFALTRGYVTLAFEGRTGMSTLHARTLSVTSKGNLKASEDAVVWIGGGAQPLTEVLPLPVGETALGLLAIEKDITHFGLVRLGVERNSYGRYGSSAPGEADVAWHVYPNGIDPAPAYGAVICGKPVVAIAEPTTAKPRAPQELKLMPINDEQLGDSTVIARSRSFFDVSLVAVKGGALVTYSADRRTWARTLRCKR